jgi:hypothetical protein
MHMHTHTEEPVTVAGHASSASVALDIGAGRGALVIYPSERFRGREIEINRAGQARTGLHTGVHERRSGAGSRLAAIFGSLDAGEYVVWSDADTAATTVTVPDGGVAEIDLD